MRIFVEPSSYHRHNRGDAMMLEVALERLRSFWPDASVTVHTSDAGGLTAATLDPSGSHGWSADAFLGLPRLLRPLRRHRPRAMASIARAALIAKRRDPSLVRRYLDAVRSADLVFVAGAGSLTDAFLPHALIVLETLELAAEAGAVTAMAGQGLGPMSDRLRRRAAEVLPRVDFIALREGVAGSPLLRSMGVDPSRVVVTGDDAITRAWAARPPHLGTALGVNLRQAPYAGVGDELVDAVGAAIRAHGAELVPLPIAEDDLTTLRRMLGGTGADDRADLLSRIARCRVVVTGSYHAAVLALSMGIPAVTVAASDYYADKFRGLAGQFGAACRIELATDSGFDARLRAAIDDAWQTAETTREPLLQAAAEQIARSEAAYRQIAALVEGRRGTERRRS